MSSLDPVPIQAGEELDYLRAVSRHFHEDESDDDLKRWLPVLGGELRSFVVRDGGRIVGNAGVYSTSISVPGGQLACGGVTAVGVSQTHRRRGLLNRMMQRCLDDGVERGEPVAALFASESAIYGRYGYGVTVPMVNYRIDRASVRFRDPVDPHLVVATDPERAQQDWPKILEQARRQHPGWVDRTPPLWSVWLGNDPESWRDGMSARRLVEVPGRGYATYRIKDEWHEVLPAGKVAVGELVATDPEAEQALWQHVCDIDLTATITAGLRPPDDALPAAVVDRLRLRITDGAPVWTRLLDVAAALGGRTYATADALVLEVEDRIRDQSGSYLLDADAEGATCVRTNRAVDLRLPIDALASVWLGGLRATQLVAARRIVEVVPGAAARLDRLVATDRAPWTPYEF